MPDEKHILVAEDSPTQAIKLVLLLQEAGYLPHVAKNGREALEYLEDQTADLVISDVMMPEMNGYEFCAAIRGRSAAAKHSGNPFDLAFRAGRRDRGAGKPGRLLRHQALRPWVSARQSGILAHRQAQGRVQGPGPAGHHSGPFLLRISRPAADGKPVAVHL